MRFYKLLALEGETCVIKLFYGFINFWLTIVKPYYEDLEDNNKDNKAIERGVKNNNYFQKDT